MLLNLFQFFQAGRNAHGGYLSPFENMRNAVDRNLSLHSDAELLAIRDGAQELIRMIEQEQHGRDADRSETPCNCAACLNGDGH